MAQPVPIAIRSYRIYFRDSLGMLSPPYEVDLASDEEARQLAGQMLDERSSCACAEVWDRARLVSVVRRGGVPDGAL